MEPVYTPVIGLARALFAAQGLRFRVTGSEHIPHEDGAVVVMNHLSYLDFTYAGLAARPSGRVIRFMCKDTIFDHPVAGPLMRGMKHIPVDRENGSASFRAALRALKDGELVGVFPEATISRSFELKEFKSGAVRMAQGARVPMIPVVLWGSQRVWTKGHPKRLGRTHTPISIDVGAPMDVPRGADVTQVVADLHARMTTMLQAAQDAYPTVPFEDRAFMPARLGGTAPTLEEATALDLEETRLRRQRRLAQDAAGTDPDEVAGQP
ncbi:lysophospholipid acyltransferase family protein [Mobilicoccus pelagius]|nr:lysophospholipid acyltransferase family protein [Mobilicoccus pelagius]